ncbi:MAG: histidinol-phosphate transaminase [Kiritimatiellae bacterium]|jgi:histidinol-phosphate aminotransferase|nr:histidinol-phosphate transaminase [Kiritimatiellia bacterium]
MKNLIKESVSSLEGYTPGEQPGSKNVIKLNTNENPYPPVPALSDGLSNFDISELRKYPNPVSSKLRNEIADYYNLEVDNVFIGNGSDEILALCTRAFVEDNGSVGYFEPSYSLYPVLTAIRDVEQRPVSLNENFTWVMPENFEASLFYLANPNAPTGMCFDKNQIIEFCGSFPGVVLIDEAYADFASYNCIDLLSKFDNVVICRTFSKSFSLAGIRLGYMLGNEKLISAMIAIKDSYNVNALTQELGYLAFKNIDYMKANVEKIKATRAVLSQELSQLGFEVCKSETNFVWTKSLKVPAKKLYEQLKAKGIFVRYFNDDLIKDYLRITVGTPEEIQRFLEELRVLLKT